MPWIRGDPSLVMSFRTILRTGKIKTLHAWMNKASASGIYKMQRFVRTLKQDQSAVDAAVEQSWSNGSGGRTHQSTKDLQAADVRSGRIRPASCSRLSSPTSRQLAPNLRKNLKTLHLEE